MSTTLLNFKRPCEACRRRKVKCDKEQPCVNCVRHGITCVYDTQREPDVPTAASQQILQERVDRLEKLIEELSSLSVRGGSEPRKLASSSSSSHPTNTTEVREDSVHPGGPGIQVFEENVSYYLGPNYWLNLQDIVYEPRCLFQVEYDEGRLYKSPAWPLATQRGPEDLSSLHLPLAHEDILVDLLFVHVEPFVRVLHESYWRQQIVDFRIGIHKIERDIEALMFASQAMTVAALPVNIVQETLQRGKGELLHHLQGAAELAFDRANITRSRKPILFIALLYYINSKFLTGESESATILLGVAGRMGMRIGLHRDPGHYSYSPWISQMRRRLWNHFMLLDNQCYNLEGAESGLSLVSDVKRPRNANDNQWTPTRFANPSLAPPDQDGFTDMTFVLVRNHIFVTQQLLIARRNEASSEELDRIVDETERYLKVKFINHLDGNIPIQQLTDSYFTASIKSLRSIVNRTNARHLATTDVYHAKLFRESVDILEEIERGETLAIDNDWGWIYRWPVVPHIVASVLLGLAQQPNHPDTNRAWFQINMVFRRHNNEEINMHKFTAWRAIENLCDQAMLSHRRAHDGAWYTRRLDPPESQRTNPPTTLTATFGSSTSELLGDVSMFGNEGPESILAMPPFFSTSNLENMGFPPWPDPNRGGPPNQ